MLGASAICRVCGATVTLLEAPLHIEDHEQAGELPDQGGQHERD